MPASPDAAPRPKIDFQRRPPTPGEGSNGLALRRISAKLRSRIDEMRVDVARTSARTVLKKFAKDGNTEAAHPSESSELAIPVEAIPDADIITENTPRPKEDTAPISLAGDSTDEPGATVSQEVGPGGWTWAAWGSTTFKGMCSNIRRYPSSHAPNITHLIADAAGQSDLDYATDNFESDWRSFFSQEKLVELARKRFASPVISTINVSPAEYQGLAKTEEQRKLFAQWFGSAREGVGEAMNRVSNIELRLFSDGQEIHILWEDGPDGKKGKVARVHRHSPTAKDRQQVELKLAQMKGMVPNTELFFGDESVLSLSELVDGEQITDPEDASRFAQMLDNRGFDGSSWDLNLGNIVKTKDGSLVFVDGDYIERLFLDQINAKTSIPKATNTHQDVVIGTETPVVSNIELSPQDVVGSVVVPEEPSVEKGEQGGDGTNVGEIIASHNAVILHGITDERVAYTAQLNRNDVRTKLCVALGLRPTLSSSAITQSAMMGGDRVLWSNLGLIINKGDVVSMHAQDAGSTPNSLAERDTVSHFSDPIEQVLVAPHNEVVVAHPQYVGFYVSLDKIGKNASEIPITSHADVHTLTADLGLPVYVIREGKFYSGHFDDAGQTFIPDGEEIPFEQFGSTDSYQPTETAQRIIDDEILQETPFNLEFLNTKEGIRLRRRDGGRFDYMTLHADDIAADPAKRALLTAASYSGVDGYDTVFEYNAESDELRRQAYLSTIRTYRDGTVSDSFLSSQVPGRSTKLQVGYDKQVGSDDEFIEHVEEVIQNARKLVDDPSTSIEGRSTWEETLREEAFYLYGFAEQAAIFGNNEAMVRALTLAESIIPRDEYEEVKIRRLGPRGEFRITEADLPV